jgi:hypothetical protein
VGPPTGLDGFGEQRNLVPTSEFEPRTVQHVAGHDTDDRSRRPICLAYIKASLFYGYPWISSPGEGGGYG